MKTLKVALFLLLVAAAVYWPHQNAAFVLDDYYTIVQNPLIKNPSLYTKIFSSHLFDAHQSSSYIKFGYYRPVLESSWIFDYHVFGLKAFGYQWVNLLMHALNGVLIYILINKLFASGSLALKTSLLFLVLPTHEWSVRYITSRGDLLSCFFGLIALLILWRAFKINKGYIWVCLFWVLAAWSREMALFYLFNAILLYYQYQQKIRSINQFALFWVLLGVAPLGLLFPLIPKLGNILVLHFLYFTLIGGCLWLGQFSWRNFLLVLMVMAGITIYQGSFWSSEEILLRHTHQWEFWPNTVARQQLLMKYDIDTNAITQLADQSNEGHIKAMWLKRLGVIAYEHGELSMAQNYLEQAIKLDSANPDLWDALAIVYRNQGDEAMSLKLLKQSLALSPNYPDTLRSLGIYFYNHQDFSQAKVFFNHCLYFDPDDVQARGLLTIANTMK